MLNNQYPEYIQDVDYTTNGPSFYDALGKINHLLQQYIVPNINKYLRGEIKLSVLTEQIQLTETTVKNFVVKNALEVKQDGLFVPDYEPLIKALDEKFKTLNVDVQADVNQKLTNMSLEVASVNNQLREKLNTSEFNIWVQTLASGTPTIYKDTLQRLQTDLPNGADGIALVKGATNADPSQVYVWTENQWQYWGDYSGVVLNDGTVTAEKLASDVLTKTSANNLAPVDFMPQGYIDKDGVYQLSARYKSSNLIPVTELEWFYGDTGSGQYTLHDRDGNYLAGYDVPTPGAFQIQQNIFVRFIRVVVDTTYPNSSVVRGKYPTSYVFTEKVLPEPKPSDMLEPDDIKYIEKISVPNLIDFEKLEVLGYYDAMTGQRKTSYLTTSTHIIPCKPGDSIFRDRMESGQISFWDSQGNYVSGIDNGNNMILVPQDSRIAGFRQNLTIGDNIRLKTAFIGFSATPERTRYKLPKHVFEVEGSAKGGGSSQADGFLKPYNALQNPVLTREMITDRTGVTGVADPFIVKEDGRYHMFFEVLSTVTGDEIGHAYSDNLIDWTYTGIVLSKAEHGHRSAYPNVFKHAGEWYMLPDTGWQVNLYKAKTFPYEWERIVDFLLPNDGGYNDTNVFEMNGKWYLTTSLGGEGIRLYENNTGVFWNDQWEFIDLIIPSTDYETNLRGGGNPIVYDDYVLFPVQVSPTDGVYGQYLYLYKLNGFSSGQLHVSNMGKLLDRTQDGSWTDGAMHHASHTDLASNTVFAVDGWNTGTYAIGLYTSNFFINTEIAEEEAYLIQAEMDGLKKQFSDVIKNATVDSEVILARGENETLGERLDSMEATSEQNRVSLSEQLHQTDLMFKVIRNPQYGKLALPPDFNSKGISLFRNGNGLITHSVNIEKYKNALKTIYVSDLGSNASGDGSSTSPYRTIHKALADALATPEDSILISVDISKSMRGEFADEGINNFITLTNKKIAVVNTKSTITHVVEAQDSGRNTIAISGVTRQPPLSWTQHTGSCYVTTRSSVGYVVDINNLEIETGTVVKMNSVNSLNECVSTPNTYFVDESSVYVHTHDSRKPDDNIEPIMNTAPLQFKLNNSTLFFEGFYFHGEKGLLVNGDIDSEFIMNQCKIGRTRHSNSLNLNDVGTTLLFECVGHDSFKDVFNYHYYNLPSENIRDVTVFEYYCTGFRAGLDDTLENNNISTMHEGANILRVGVVGHTTKGTPCADINGSYSVLFDCHMSGTVAHPLGNYSNGYYFYTDANKSGLGAKVYMENCSAQGERQDILLDTGTELNLRSYRGDLNRIIGNGVLNIV